MRAASLPEDDRGQYNSTAGRHGVPSQLLGAETIVLPTERKTTRGGDLAAASTWGKGRPPPICTATKDNAAPLGSPRIG
jgi:hypothetical protein